MKKQDLKDLQNEAIKRSGLVVRSIMELPAFSQKSFYGKALEIVADDGIYLMSYSTIVCSISFTGNVKRLWHGYSVTTMKHINDFLFNNGCDTINKKCWCSMSVH